MTEKEIHIIEAAFAVFLRYGAKRTSMNDIAQEAGIARQTLYNAFSNKDVVLRATIRLFTERAMVEIEKGLKSCESLGDQLDIVFEQLAVNRLDGARTLASPVPAGGRLYLRTATHLYCIGG